MINNKIRHGNFSSSEIWKLTTKDRSGKEFGAPAYTYIKKKLGERVLKRSFDLGKHSQSTIWGEICEYYCSSFHLLGYELISKTTTPHSKYPFWVGSCDAVTENKAVEIKCFEMDGFFELSSALIQLNEKEITIEDFKKDFKEIYWQVVSNSIILNKPICEIIAYTPTEKQLLQIREEIEETNVLEKLGIEPWQGRFITENKIYQLPFIPEGIEYPNFVKFEFQPSAEDIIFLTGCVLKAEKLLTNG